MLRITQSENAHAAKGYYAVGMVHEGYYHEGQDIAGRWGGKAAAMLGLDGFVTQEAFHALCDNLHPMTAEPLTPRTRSVRRPGSDFNFHCPKSVSVVHALTGDERIVEAFRASVAETMQALEADVMTRVRKGGSDTDRVTGNFVYGEFIHFEARPVNGVADPHLHAHCFTFNATFDAVEGRFKAAQFGKVVREAGYHEAIFHSKFSSRMAALGYGIERNEKFWELAGVPHSVIDKFSRRTALIEELAEAKGITRADDKARLGAATREGKGSALGGDAMRKEWDARLTPEERAAVFGALGAKPLTPALSAAQATDRALSHEFERVAVVPSRRVQAKALKLGVGSASLAEVERELSRPDVIGKVKGGETLLTTKEVLAEERNYLKFAREGRGTCRPLGMADYRIPPGTLSNEQERVARAVLSSRDACVVIAGRAGTGKSTTLVQIRDGLLAADREIHAYAPTAAASRDGLRALGFDGAETVARLLIDPKHRDRLHPGSVLLIDEAGLLSSKQLSQVAELCRQKGVRLCLVGDELQHASVDRGGNLFRLLESHAGVKPIELVEVWRQRHDEYKQVVTSISKGDLAGSFDRLDAMGWVKEIPGAERYQALAKEYVRSVAEGRSTLVVSPTHAEGAKVSEAIRAEMKASGLLGADERLVRSDVTLAMTEAERSDPTSYKPGQAVRFHRACKGIKAGERAVTLGRDPLGGVEIRLSNGYTLSLPLKHADRFGVFQPREIPLATGDRIRIAFNGKTLDGKHRISTGDLHSVAGFDDEGNIRLANGWHVAKDYGGLTSGLVVTSHASQSKTFDTVLVGQSAASLPASSANQWYVSLSRGRDQTTVFTDNKAALRDAIQPREVRASATELVGDVEVRKPPLREQWKRHAERINRLASQTRAYASQIVESWRERFSASQRQPATRREGGFAHGR